VWAPTCTVVRLARVRPCPGDTVSGVTREAMAWNPDSTSLGSVLESHGPPITSIIIERTCVCGAAAASAAGQNTICFDEALLHRSCVQPFTPRAGGGIRPEGATAIAYALKTNAEVTSVELPSETRARARARCVCACCLRASLDWNLGKQACVAHACERAMGLRSCAHACTSAQATTLAMPAQPLSRRY
jgi:hypothetical protein